MVRSGGIIVGLLLDIVEVAGLFHAHDLLL